MATITLNEISTYAACSRGTTLYILAYSFEQAKREARKEFRKRGMNARDLDVYSVPD